MLCSLDRSLELRQDMRTTTASSLASSQTSWPRGQLDWDAPVREHQLPDAPFERGSSLDRSLELRQDMRTTTASSLASSQTSWPRGQLDWDAPVRENQLPDSPFERGSFLRVKGTSKGCQRDVKRTSPFELKFEGSLTLAHPWANPGPGIALVLF